MTDRRLAAIFVAATMALALASMSAKADNVDFTCSLGILDHCTGTVVQSGSNFSTTGINDFNDSGPYPVGVAFTLAFNTATGAISIDGTGSETGQDLIGNITSFSVTKGTTTTDFGFTANWPTLPPLIQAFLGTKTGVDSGFVIFDNKSGAAQSVDVVITPVPEPSSLLLLGSGLVGIGGFLRRKLSARA